jgi:uridine kinase
VKPIIIGVAGGTGSGKTTVSQEILRRVGAQRIAFIQHDSYYCDQSHLLLEERAKLNYDHPDSLESDLLVAHLRQLQVGQAVNIPMYDFTQYTRLSETHFAGCDGILPSESAQSSRSSNSTSIRCGLCTWSS